jgi:hypothetical protein
MNTPKNFVVRGDRASVLPAMQTRSLGCRPIGRLRLGPGSSAEGTWGRRPCTPGLVHEIGEADLHPRSRQTDRAHDQSHRALLVREQVLDDRPYLRLDPVRPGRVLGRIDRWPPQSRR